MNVCPFHEGPEPCTTCHAVGRWYIRFLVVMVLVVPSVLWIVLALTK